MNKLNVLTLRQGLFLVVPLAVSYLTIDRMESTRSSLILTVPQVKSLATMLPKTSSNNTADHVLHVSQGANGTALVTWTPANPVVLFQSRPVAIDRDGKIRRMLRSDYITGAK